MHYISQSLSKSGSPCFSYSRSLGPGPFDYALKCPLQRPITFHAKHNIKYRIFWMNVVYKFWMWLEKCAFESSLHVKAALFVMYRNLHAQYCELTHPYSCYIWCCIESWDFLFSCVAPRVISVRCSRTIFLDKKTCDLMIS